MTHDATSADPKILDTYLAKCFREMMDGLSRESEDIPEPFAEILESEFWDLL